MRTHVTRGSYRSLILICALVIFLLYAALALVVPPAMFSDPGWGFLVWQSMNRGGPYNVRLSPDPHNIVTDEHIFAAWWTPGQYVIPGILSKCGLSLGKAIWLTVTLYSAIGVLGWYCLCRYWGLSTSVASLTCVFIVSNRFFALPFGIYNGGEILVFGVLPWIMLVFLKHSDVKPTSIPILVATFLLGTLMKLSFLVTVVALLTSGFLLFAAEANPLRVRAMVSWCTRAAFTFGIFYGIVWYAHLSRGAVPVGAVGPTWTTAGMVFTLVNPLLSALSGDDLLRRAFLFPGAPVVRSYSDLAPFVFPIVFLEFYIAFRLWRDLPSRSYTCCVVGFTLTYPLVMAVLYSRGASVSLDARHFRPAGLILIPGMLWLLERSSRVWRLLAAAALLVFALYGVTSYFVRFRANSAANNVGSLGFTHLIISKDAFHLLRYVDDNLPLRNNVVYVTSPEIGLELMRSRCLGYHADFRTLEDLSAQSYEGRTDALLLVVQASFLESGKARAIARSFKGYDQWRFAARGGFLFVFPAENEEVENALRTYSASTGDSLSISDADWVQR